MFIWYLFVYKCVYINYRYIIYAIRRCVFEWLKRMTCNLEVASSSSESAVASTKLNFDNWMRSHFPYSRTIASLLGK